MFNQVAVPPEDQAALRFLWRQSPESEIEVYQYLRHIFGLSVHQRVLIMPF